MTRTASPPLADEPAVPGTAPESVAGMPPWRMGELPDAPRFTARNWFALLGPGLLMGGASIGGGEWLMGPVVAARYGPGLMWLATLSIVGQVFYNLEISRYTLYTGEPIFTGKFRTRPGPTVWLVVYLLLDFNAVFPYLAANAATPVVAIMLGEVPNSQQHETLLRVTSICVFLACMLPMIFGGKIYNTLKTILFVKVIVVLGFLLFLAVFHSSASTWAGIFRGFVEVGNVATPDGQVKNVFTSLYRGEGLPPLDLTMMAYLAAFAAIAGAGGLSNVAISNYTRDQGWGMGKHVGAIPSVTAGREIKLSHVGMVFSITPESLARWRRWYRHVLRDQAAVWMPACFLGVALPALLSVEYLPRGTAADSWVAAGMTADGAARHVGAAWGAPWATGVWYGVIVCGLLVLAPTTAQAIDGVIRRWVDVFWTSSRRLRAWDERKIKYLYFSVLLCHAALGVVLLSTSKPLTLLVISTNLMNFSLGFSCFHTLYVNKRLLPRPLRPGWFATTGLVLAGTFFTLLALVTAAATIYAQSAG